MAHPFPISIEPAVLNDLRSRLQNTRYIHSFNNDKWEKGTNEPYLKELCNYWANGFNWKKQEAYLNTFSHFKTTIDGRGIHYIHEKGKGSKTIPLLLIHGFPDSFVRFLKVIPLLTEADEDGFSFDLVIPSLPGYGFSDIPNEPGMNHQRMADLFGRHVYLQNGSLTYNNGQRCRQADILQPWSNPRCLQMIFASLLKNCNEYKDYRRPLFSNFNFLCQKI